MVDEPKISVVVPTYGRAETLRRTLDHVAKQDLDPIDYEVIVVDDDSPDHTRRVVEEIIPSMPCRTIYLHHPNHGPGYTANRGIREARAPIVELIADDIWLAPGALRAHLKCHAAHPELEVAVLGRVAQSPELRQTVFLQQWDPFQFRDLDEDKPLPYWKFWVCNISIKREFLLRYGMFREVVGRAGPSDHHDPELGALLRHHGLCIHYCRDAWAYHYHPFTLDQAIDRYYERGLNWEPFRRIADDPELDVQAHLLNRETLHDHRRVLAGPNHLKGLDRYLGFHILLQFIRVALFNRPALFHLWRPFFDWVERNTILARLANRQVYRLFLYSHFVRGVQDAPARYST